MIYFDNAATTMTKPFAVTRAVLNAMYHAGGYGRSGHAAAMRAGELVYVCRERAAALFGLPEPEQVVFTMNATHALNLAIHAMITPRSRVAVSSFEHNSVIRPLTARGIAYRVLHALPFDDAAMLEQTAQALADGCDLFIINHVSNVFGTVAPLEQIDRLLAERGVPMIVDASQSAGALPIDVSGLLSAAAVCMPGHKGLYGPQGTGMLLAVQEHALRRTLMQGGTGSASVEATQPMFLPDRLESGTPNVPGIAGLSEGLDFVLHEGAAAIGAHERALTARLMRYLDEMKAIETFCAPDGTGQSGVLSFRHERIPCETLAQVLAERSVCVRAGLHCAPLAHKCAGTFETGTVRVSFSAFNTQEEVDRFAEILGNVIRKL